MNNLWCSCLCELIIYRYLNNFKIIYFFPWGPRIEFTTVIRNPLKRASQAVSAKLFRPKQCHLWMTLADSYPILSVFDPCFVFAVHVNGLWRFTNDYLKTSDSDWLTFSQLCRTLSIVCGILRYDTQEVSRLDPISASVISYQHNDCDLLLVYKTIMPFTGFPTVTSNLENEMTLIKWDQNPFWNASYYSLQNLLPSHILLTRLFNISQ